MTALPTLLGASLIEPNPGLIIWTVVTFVVVAIVLRLFAWKPILEMVEQREKRIEEALESSARQREEAERMIEEHKQALEKARKEAAEMVREAKEDVEKARTEQLEKARAEAEKLIASARRQIEEEQKKAFQEVRKVAVDLAIAAAGKLIEASMDEAKQRKLVEEYLAQLPVERAN